MKPNDGPYDFCNADINILSAEKWGEIKDQYGTQDPLFPGIGFRNKVGNLAFPAFKCILERSENSAAPSQAHCSGEHLVCQDQVFQTNDSWKKPVDIKSWIRWQDCAWPGPDYRVGIIDSGCGDKNISSVSFNQEIQVDAWKDDIEGGHGTHVAHIIKTIAPTAIILSAKSSTDEKLSNFSKILCALIWLANEGARIVNISIAILELPRNAQIVYQELLRALFFERQVLVFCAIGLDSIDQPNGKPFSYLALPNFVVKVGAINSSGRSCYRPDITRNLVSCAGPYYVQCTIPFWGYSAACPVAAATYYLYLKKHGGNLWEALKEFYYRCDTPSMDVGFGKVKAPECVK